MPPLGRAEDASRQIEQAVRFITSHHGVRRVSIIAHSWGRARWPRVASLVAAPSSSIVSFCSGR
jgi:esterase/lipase superfamily enzyme